MVRASGWSGKIEKATRPQTLVSNSPRIGDAGIAIESRGGAQKVGG